MPRFSIFFIGLIMVLLLSECANMRAPQGGPKDMDPPIVLESEPHNYSVHFSADKITLKFDEFVSVSDVITEVFISPPFRNTPEIKTRGKSVIISIEEELLENTTYSIFFGNAIKDITEGNPLENYNYVFSTGDKIDSLSVVGEILDAFTLKPKESVLVMLYEDNNDTIPFDSLPFLVKPAYLTRTSPEGFFVINNIKTGIYDLISLADNNMSATYDNAEEEVAFLDSLISPRYLAPIEKDSLTTDSIAEADTLLPDYPLEDFYSMFMFKEVDSTQRLLGVDKPRKKVLRFIFRHKAEDVLIEPLIDVSDDWKLSEWNKGMDTLRYYIMDDELDTISLKISLDTLVFDTISYSLKDKKLPQRKKDMEEAQILKISAPRTRPFPHFNEYKIAIAYPIREHDFSRFMLAEGEDTLQPELSVFGDAQRMIKLDRRLKESTTYSLFLPDSVLYDILGRSNDTTYFDFTTSEEEDFGLYRIHVTNSSPYEKIVIQLLTEDEKFLKEEIVGSDAIITWEHLKARKYMLKAYGDLNQNGHWDTGKLYERKQAEPVVYYPELLEVREGWTFDLEWDVVFK